MTNKQKRILELWNSGDHNKCRISRNAKVSRDYIYKTLKNTKLKQQTYDNTNR